MFIDDNENVFYEDSFDIKLLATIQFIRPFLLFTTGLLLLTYYLLLKVEKYEGHCPMHAECGVFIHCHQGYELIDSRCEVSQETKEQV